MKKLLLLLTASLMLIGAGCAAQPASPSTAPAPSAQPAPAPEPAQAPAPSPGVRPTGGMPIKGGTENVNGQGQLEFHPGAQVTVTAGGTFSPAVIAIKAGETVTWTNESSNPVWIASNPHPTHTDYPGFDSKAPVGQGETYAFTFDKAGSWGYHNHFSPTVQGTVIVTE